MPFQGSWWGKACRALKLRRSFRAPAVLVLALAQVMLLGSDASAVDFNIRGQWLFSFDYGQNGGLTGGGGRTGYAPGEDEFEAQQRVRLQLDAVASESLSGTVQFQIGAQRWGQASQGGALGADATNVIRLRQAYLDWRMPQTDLQTRMGIQRIGLPSATMHASQIFDSNAAGVVLNYPITENIGVTAFWSRLLNDNFDAEQSQVKYGTPGRAGFLDNVDMFALTIPMDFDGVKVTPFGAYTMIGPNAIRMYQTSNLGPYYNYLHTIYPAPHTSIPTFGDANDFLQGMFPMGASRRNDGRRHASNLTGYANAWWAGLALDITRWDPFHLAFDFNWGSVSWDDSYLNRAGWLASLLLEYKLDWGIPGLYGWYASGDDDDAANGSERMPYMAITEPANEFAYYAFSGGKEMRRGQGQIAAGVTGTWGIGARLKDVSFIEDLRHTLRVVYMGGTNSPKMARRIARDFRNLGGNPFGTSVDGAVAHRYHYWVGGDSHYLTTNDSAMEISLNNTWQMYENLAVSLNAGYVALWLDKSDWGSVRDMNGKDDTTRDMWNVNLLFEYSF